MSRFARQATNDSIARVLSVSLRSKTFESSKRYVGKMNPTFIINVDINTRLIAQSETLQHFQAGRDCLRMDKALFETEFPIIEAVKTGPIFGAWTSLALSFALAIDDVITVRSLSYSADLSSSLPSSSDNAKLNNLKKMKPFKA